MRPASIISLASLFLVIACNKNPEPATEHFKQGALNTEKAEIREVVYSMDLPTDLSELFNRSGTNYDPYIPAPVENINIYTDMEQIAVMLGIYGVDLTYIRLMGQRNAAATYYNAIKMLSERAGIPGVVFEKSSRQLEKYFNNEDSLAVVIENIYRETDRHFRQNGQENLAALSLAGGWTEAMFIGSRIFKADSGNNSMAELLLQQKYSMNSVFTILSNYQESLRVKELLLMLKRLRKVFNDVEIWYRKEGFILDTASRRIQTVNADIRYNENTMKHLLSTLPLIRENLIAPWEQSSNKTSGDIYTDARKSVE